MYGEGFYYSIQDANRCTMEVSYTSSSSMMHRPAMVMMVVMPVIIPMMIPPMVTPVMCMRVMIVTVGMPRRVRR